MTELSVEAAAAAIAELSETVVPDIPMPPSGHVRLAGGLVQEDRVVYDVDVRELTGEHEETIARARRSPSLTRFVSTLLECGTEKIGGEPATRAELKKMLIGDRDLLLLEIRRSTYGDEIAFEGVICPGCGESSNITFTLDMIPISRLDKSEDRQFKVKLRKGDIAVVNLPTGEDQEHALDNPDLTGAEQDTLVLQRCVLTITDSNGLQTIVPAKPSSILNMGIPDRRTILNEIAKRQPGPRYDEVSFTHEACGKEIPVRLGLGDLFPYL
jgi:hypothetical protein